MNLLILAYSGDRNVENRQDKRLPAYLHWPHMQAGQVRGLGLREIGGGFTKHHRAPSIRSACYAIAKPSTILQKMQNIKKLRGHRNAVYCGTVALSTKLSISILLFENPVLQDRAKLLLINGHWLRSGYAVWDTDSITSKPFCALSV